MSITVTLGVNKKVGLPDYGSAGSHCDVVIEVDTVSLENPQLFQKKVQSAYNLARQAVEDELAHHKAGTTQPVQNEKPTPPPKTEYSNASNGGSTRFPASEKQWTFINRLLKGFRSLNQQRLDSYCRNTFGRGCDELSSRDASMLIDNLKNAKAEGRSEL